MGRVRGLFLGLACLTLPACAGDDRVVVVDLVEEFETADQIVERQVIDFGKPAARQVMREGWAATDERDGEMSFVWGVGRYSAFDLSLVEARPLTLTLEGRSRTHARDNKGDRPPDEIRVEVNAWSSGTMTLHEGRHAYTIEIPESAVSAGANRVELHYLRAGGRMSRRTRNGRRVGWLRAMIDGALSLDVPRPGRDDQVLSLSFNTGLDFLAKVPSGAMLTMSGLTASDGALPGASLQVEVEVDGATAPATHRLEPSAWLSPTDIPIPVVGSHSAVRVSLRAWPESDGQVAGGLTIIEPVLSVVGQVAPTEDPTAAPRVGPAATASNTGIRPNVLVYLIDTLRADHLGVYGYSHETSPEIDALAADGVVFTTAVAQSAWTRTSVASIFTGVHPRSHAVNGRSDSLAPEAATIATLLAEAGYGTGAYVTNANVASNFGFDLGFDTFLHLREQDTGEVHIQSDVLTERAIMWLQDRDTSRPFFLYLHATDPHSPYTPRSPYRERFVPSRKHPELYRTRELGPMPLDREETREILSEVVGLYDAEIAFNDHHFGRLIGWLEETGLYDSTLIIVTSDHGEEFLDHGRWGHGGTLYEEQTGGSLDRQAA